MVNISKMLEVRLKEVRINRQQGRVCEPCSDISRNFGDMRSGFGYKLLGKTVVWRVKYD